jgi:hypothetical protein
MQPVKVLHMTSVHSALDHRIFKKECRALARAGFDVAIVGPYPDDTMQEQVRIIALEKSRSRLSRMTRTVWRVYQEAVKHNADIYHFHDPELIPLALLLRARGKRVVYDIHEDYPKDVLAKPYLPGWSRPWIARVVEHIEGLACRRFSALVAVTPSIADRFQRINSRTIVIYNYPYPEELLGETAVSWERRRPAVSYIGTITAQRGIAEMVSAMGMLPGSVPATLEIAGDCIPEKVTKLPGWSRVKFHGVLDQLAAYRLLRESRVGIVCEHPIPSFLESVPVKVFEYMGAGVPVIASNFPLWRKMLDKVGCTIFVDPAKVCEIADAIEYLLTHPLEAEEMGRRGQVAVIDQFNWNTQAGKLVSLYQDLVSPTCAA